MTSFMDNSTQSLGSGNDLNLIEFELQNIFHMINPRNEFRDKLKLDLLSYPGWKLSLPKFLRYGFLLFAGVSSAIVILLTGIRAVFAVIGAIKIFRQEKSRSHEDITRPIRSQIVPL